MFADTVVCCYDLITVVCAGTVLPKNTIFEFTCSNWLVFNVVVLLTTSFTTVVVFTIFLIEGGGGGILNTWDGWTLNPFDWTVFVALFVPIGTVTDWTIVGIVWTFDDLTKFTAFFCVEIVSGITVVCGLCLNMIWDYLTNLFEDYTTRWVDWANGFTIIFFYEVTCSTLLFTKFVVTGTLEMAVLTKLTFDVLTGTFLINWLLLV